MPKLQITALSLNQEPRANAFAFVRLSYEAVTFSKEGSLSFLTIVNLSDFHIFPGFPVISPASASVSCLFLSVTHEALRIFGKPKQDDLSSWEFLQSVL